MESVSRLVGIATGSSVNAANGVRTGSGSDRVSPRSGRMIIAQRFIAGNAKRSECEVRTADD